MTVAAEKLLTLGVDTHLDKHVSVLINNLGQIVSTEEFETTVSSNPEMSLKVGITTHASTCRS